MSIIKKLETDLEEIKTKLKYANFVNILIDFYVKRDNFVFTDNLEQETKLFEENLFIVQTLTITTKDVEIFNEKSKDLIDTSKLYEALSFIEKYPQYTSILIEIASSRLQ